MNYTTVSLNSIHPYPDNPRKGNVAVIAESLKAYGQYKPITVNQNTGEILAGNHTYEAAKSLGWTEISVVYVNVDEVTAAKIVAIDNRSSDLGKYDNETLALLLADLPDLEGTGYQDTDLDDLKALLQEQSTPDLDLQAPITKNYMPTVEVGESGQSNAKFTTSLGEYAERYAQKTTRMLMMDFPNDLYVWLIEKLTAYRASNNLTSNADAMIKLLEDVSGEKAPHETV
jgi:hypothetical protein